MHSRLAAGMSRTAGPSAFRLRRHCRHLYPRRLPVDRGGRRALPATVLPAPEGTGPCSDFPPRTLFAYGAVVSSVWGNYTTCIGRTHRDRAVHRLVAVHAHFSYTSYEFITKLHSIMETQQTSASVHAASRRLSFDTAAAWALALTGALAAIAFIPFGPASFVYTKTFILSLGGLIALALYILARLTRGNLILPPVPLLGADRKSVV